MAILVFIIFIGLLSSTTYDYTSHREHTQEIIPSHDLQLGENSTWGAQGQDYFFLNERDAQGNLYVLGNTQSYGEGMDDLLLMKYASNGSKLWERVWGAKTWIASAI